MLLNAPRARITAWRDELSGLVTQGAPYYLKGTGVGIAATGQPADLESLNVVIQLLPSGNNLKEISP